MTAELHTRLRKAGILAIPIKMPDKSPAGGLDWGKWRDNPTAITDEEYNRAWSVPYDAVAVICGKIEALDIDTDADPTGTIHERYDTELRRHLPPHIYERLFIEKTLSGGVHYWYRVDTPMPNTALARIEYSDDDLFVLGKTSPVGVVGETRGAGGYCICAPSPGYTAIQGSIFELSGISDEHRDIMWQVARSFNTYVKPAVVAEEPRAPGAVGKRPGDVYQDEVGIEEIVALFASHGWRAIRKIGSKVYLNRPGAKHPMKHDADIDVNRRTVMNYSSSVTAFDPGRGYSFFSALTILAHGGDVRAAARDVAARGFNKDDEKNTLQVGPAGPAGEETVVEAAVDILEEMAEYEFSLDNKPTYDYTFFINTTPANNPYRVDKQGVGFPGASIIISGVEKSRKSTLASAIAAAAVKGEACTVFEFAQKCKVLWIDTEQPTFYFWRTIWRVCVQAGIEKDDPNFRAFTLMHQLPNERVDSITKLIARLKPDVVICDGIGDLIWDTNDYKESARFMDGPHKEWRLGGVMLFSIVHENSGKDNKMRGHQGSVAQRKCDGALQVKAITENTVDVSNKLSRGARFENFMLTAGRAGILFDKEMPAYNFDLAGQGKKEPEPEPVTPDAKATLDDLPF